MPLTREQVEKVSLLARLRLTEAELETMTAQLGAIVGYIEQLAELDTESSSRWPTRSNCHNVFRRRRSAPEPRPRPRCWPAPRRPMASSTWCPPCSGD